MIDYDRLAIAVIEELKRQMLVVLGSRGEFKEVEWFQENWGLDSVCAKRLSPRYTLEELLRMSSDELNEEVRKYTGIGPKRASAIVQAVQAWKNRSSVIDYDRLAKAMILIVSDNQTLVRIPLTERAAMAETLVIRLAPVVDELVGNVEAYWAHPSLRETSSLTFQVSVHKTLTEGALEQAFGLVTELVNEQPNISAGTVFGLAIHMPDRTFFKEGVKEINN